VRFVGGLTTALLLGVIGAGLAAPSPAPAAGTSAAEPTAELAMLNQAAVAYAHPRQ